jgi:branched-chain amino acid transport system permease protein
MVDFIQNTLDGIALGSAYALLALGFTLIFGVMGRLNIAYGPCIMIGVFAGAGVYSDLTQSIVMIFVATLAGTILASAYVERVSFAAIRADAALASMVSTFAVWMQLEEIVAHLFPARTYAFKELGHLSLIEAGPFFLRQESLFMLLVTLAVLLGLALLLGRSHFGLELRALTDSRRAAIISGINVRRIIFLTFLLAAMIGGVAGFMIAMSDGQVTPKFGLWATMKGLVAMVIGGLASLRGAVLGGMLLGIIEAQAQWYFGASVREILVYAILFAALILLPRGILGGPHTVWRS